MRAPTVRSKCREPRQRGGRPQTSNSTAVKETTSRGAPMNPSTGTTRETRRALYSREPSRALTAGRTLCPSRKVRSQPDERLHPQVLTIAHGHHEALRHDYRSDVLAGQHHTI